MKEPFKIGYGAFCFSACPGRAFAICTKCNGVAAKCNGVSSRLGVTEFNP